ncbi:DUF1684 domain-containing protein [Catenulispora yoronensis]
MGGTAGEVDPLPYGFLALVATDWLDATEADLGLVPGRWSAAPDGRVRVRAGAADGLLLADEPLDGTADLRPDLDPEPQTLTHGARRLVPIVREGRAGLRVFDPSSPAHESFDGIELFPYDPGLAVPGVYTPYDAERVEQVQNADGAERGLALAGEVAFELGGERRTLAVSATPAGLNATFGDLTNGADTFGFRFLDLAAPDEQGRVEVDFNRAYLPPCAFTDHSLCPLPPVGNRLAAAVAAGERRAVFRR